MDMKDDRLKYCPTCGSEAVINHEVYYYGSHVRCDNGKCMESLKYVLFDKWQDRPNEPSEPNEMLDCKLGLYYVYWKESAGGGSSIAAIGYYPNGKRWIAPANWVSGSTPLIGQVNKIEHLELIERV